MGTKREQLGYVIEVKPYRKHGNGAKGGGRQGSSGKKCSLFKLGPGNKEELVATAEGATAKAAVRQLRTMCQVIPAHVSVNHKGRTYF